MIVSFQNINYILFGIIILILLLVVRYFVVYLSTFKGNFDLDDKRTMLVMMPRGLAAAILAIKFGDEFVNRFIPGNIGFFKDVAFVVILGTAIITTIGVSLICHYEMKKTKKPEAS